MAERPTPGTLADWGPEADPEQVARTIALRRLESAPRTRSELAQTLSKRGVPDEVSERVLDRFTEVGLIDDAAFARAWVSSRHHGRGLGRRALETELRRKGVDPELIEQACSELDAQSSRERAFEIASRKAAHLHGVERDKALRRLVGHVTRRGYPPAVAYDVAREALAGALEQRQDDPIDELGAGVVLGDFTVDE